MVVVIVTWFGCWFDVVVMVVVTAGRLLILHIGVSVWDLVIIHTGFLSCNGLSSARVVAAPVKLAAIAVASALKTKNNNNHICI